VRKTLNQVDQKLINARFFGIWPGMFGLVQGRVGGGELGPQLGPRHRYLPLHAFFHNTLVSRKKDEKMVRSDTMYLSPLFLRSVT
jgi:hypothetical protein